MIKIVKEPAKGRRHSPEKTGVSKAFPPLKVFLLILLLSHFMQDYYLNELI